MNSSRYHVPLQTIREGKEEKTTTNTEDTEVTATVVITGHGKNDKGFNVYSLGLAFPVTVKHPHT